MGAARASRVIGALCATVAVVVCAVAVLSGRAAVAAPESPAGKGMHEGVASCADSSCHSRQVDSGVTVRQNELITWQDPSSPAGVHSRAWRVLTQPRAQAIARKMGHTLVAPIVTLEPGRPDGERVAPGSVFLSQATYRAVLTDMAMSLKGMGFKNVVLMGDSGGNQGAMKEVAATLDEKFKAAGTRFYFIPEYYDYASVQKMLQSSGIPEKIEIGASQGSDQIHEEYGIDALMALYDPRTIRIDERTKANRATINGVSLLPMSKTLEMAKKIVELRATLTVNAVNKAMGK